MHDPLVVNVLDQPYWRPLRQGNEAGKSTLVIPDVDLVVLTRHGGPLCPEVERGFRNQRAVRLFVHRVAGSTYPDDRNRLDAIVRARNEGKLLGGYPWLMFLDDDVVLEPCCISTLVDELGRRPAYAALAADYLGESRADEIARHVSMGATLFRRRALEQIRFRWHEKKCECQWCCDDLRRLQWGIDYCDSARAHHLAKNTTAAAPTVNDVTPAPTNVMQADPLVLVAFDRRHLKVFRERFLASLRASGNNETVMPVAVGLYPSERQRLARAPGTTPLFRNANGAHVARRRLREFAEITSALPPESPVAYWDAGDIIFQGSLQPLWELVRAYPDKLLAAREPTSHPENGAVAVWTESISDPAARREAQQTIFHRPFINSGFLAGDAGTLAKYFQTVSNWYDSPKLAGSIDWGDQLALNVYCHSLPEVWQEIPESWNYCLWGRNRKTCHRRGDGRYVDVRGVPIHVVHGNAQTLDWPPLPRETF
jgi:hypothetical protein